MNLLNSLTDCSCLRSLDCNPQQDLKLEHCGQNSFSSSVPSGCGRLSIVLKLLSEKDQLSPQCLSIMHDIVRNASDHLRCACAVHCKFHSSNPCVDECCTSVIQRQPTSFSSSLRKRRYWQQAIRELCSWSLFERACKITWFSAYSQRALNVC